MSQKKVRFEYYQVVYRRNNDGANVRDRLFDLLVWMDQANRRSLEGRTFDYRQEQARLETTYWDTELGFYFLHFVRLRDTNIPSTARATAQVEPLELEDDEYIGEEVSALYDEMNHVLMLQRNKYSLGPEGIEEYLNLIWDTEEEQIYLRPICPPNVFDMARRSTEYRKINLRFADLSNINPEQTRNRLRSPIGNIFSSFERYRGINAQVTITVGNTRNSLDEETVNDTLTDIEDNAELFSRAEIARRADDDTSVELIDLFAHKAHDFGTFRVERRETLSHEAIAQQMWKIYSANEDCRNRQRDINSYLRN
ncbi:MULTISPECIES: DUF6731 family protein [Bacillus amyloliquefaciens group]|uniref:DUF6731 family protein n=1 Tax=Bacillus amyloliquefaciens group TaxID=1938374 RepID=UPI000F5E110B|nr:MULTISPECIES: DUF6731 family protein [Bacillus amyloliquefaciens group]AZI47395.1 hypothetical protein BVMH_11015 [Bacillus velezensis]QYC33202.1 hypothetical protein J5X95_19920 [Bacillus amyloliquefaciens]QYC33240.1 hypothetical protein J5X95_00085 [Bacillus amyloliquefaciens]